MSTMCFGMLCRDCDWHVIKGGKLGCNHGNRLGLGKPALAEIVEEEVEEEVEVEDAG